MLAKILFIAAVVVGVLVVVFRVAPARKFVTGQA